MSSQNLQVVALISGGKDSLFSILHCIANGHDVVALANLYPSAEQNPEDEDINSYMYQTVGHSIIPLYAEVLGIPLYRQPIVGSAANSSRDYAPQVVVAAAAAEREASTTSKPTEDDETESLIPLLQRIKDDHPGANAVSTGAILSTYQRTRIESVAIRLGLVPLSFLWQYPYLPPYQQSSLLQDMRAVGQDARIIKVASGGLDASFLWQNVADGRVVRKLKARMGQFGGTAGGAVLGEGGEFETLAIAGPSPLWKGRIEVEKVTTVTGEGGSALVRLGNPQTVMDKPDGSNVLDGDDSMLKTGSKSHLNSYRDLRIPQVLDSEFAEILLNLEATTPTGRQSTTNKILSEQSSRVSMGCLTTFSATQLERHGRTIHIANITSPRGSAAEQMKSIIIELGAHLVGLNSTASSIVSSTLLLHNMEDFTIINPIYGAIFTEPIPPSRVTVSCGDCLPSPVKVSLSVIIDVGSRSRRNGLHVQSRSYWAPANIGPYSQAVAVPIASAPLCEGDADTHPATLSPKIVHVAGQIPLIPSSMELARSEDYVGVEQGSQTPEHRQFMLQTVLSLQHLWRIGRVMDVVWWAAGVAFISSASTDTGDERVQIIAEAWKLAFKANWDHNSEDDEEDDDEKPALDAWDLKNRGGLASETEEKDMRSALPDYSQLVNAQSNIEPVLPPCFAIQVESLPRGADIEWTAPGLADCKIQQVKSKVGKRSSYITEVQGRGTDYQIQYYDVPNTEAFRDIVALEKKKDSEIAPSTGGKWCRCECTIYTTRDVPTDALQWLKPTVVPCRRIWNGSEGESGSIEVLAVVAVKREVLPS